MWSIKLHIAFIWLDCRALYFLHDKEEGTGNNGDEHLSTSFRCYRCKGIDDNTNFEVPAKKSRRSKVSELPSTLQTKCSNCDSLSSTYRACQDRSHLKAAVDSYKTKSGGTFQVHIILSQPVDYEEDFLEFASQPGAIED